MQSPNRNFGRLITLIIAAISIAMLLSGCGLFKSDLEKLNDKVSQLNQTQLEAEGKVGAYDDAVAEATQLRTSIADVSDDNQTYLGIVDQRLASAQTHYERAQQLLDQSGPRLTAFEEHSKELDQQVDSALENARQANQEMQLAFDELSAIKQMMSELDVEYTRQFLWFEMADYWPRESSYSNHKACYYGEVVNTINPDGSVNETIVDDSVDGGFLNSDKKGTHWKIFTVDDYDYLVSQGIVQPMDKEDPSETDVGRYLCGEKPQDGQYGALGEPPITIVKERGVLALSQEDEDTFVGNYRYGSWCAPNENGEYTAIPEEEDPPQTAEWCWHMPEGGDTRFYYYYLWNGSSWGYTQGPRRCFDCNAQSWTGNPLVPANRMSQVTGMDAPSVRNPVNDGGPGSGK